MGLVSKSDIARRAGVNPSTVTRACRDGGVLWEALRGGRIDEDHPAAIKFVASRRPPEPELVPAPTELPRRNKRHRRELADVEELPELAEALREVTDRFGPVPDLKELAELRLKLAQADAQELKNRERKREVIERATVLTDFVAPVDAGFRRLLADFPEKVGPLARATASNEECVELLRKELERVIQPTAAAIGGDDGGA